MNNDHENFEPIAKIIVIGIGGAGNNAVNHMIDEDIQNVEFYAANTDKQTLSISKIPNQIILGKTITNGLGAGGDPSIGKTATEASENEIREIVKGKNLVFIAAGMGGGTGTGGAPVVAKIAKEEGCLTMAIVTRPFKFEGPTRNENATKGLKELKEIADSLIIVSNDNLLKIDGSLPIDRAFEEADKVLAKSVKTVSNLILLPSFINLDFADVDKTLRNGGITLIGFGSGKGENADIEATQSTINNPLIEQTIEGAKTAICHITCGPSVSLNKNYDCVNHIFEASKGTLDIKFGIAVDETLDDEILISLIATHFEEDKKIEKSIEEEILSTEILENSNETEPDIDDEDDDIIPNFLKDLVN